MRVLLVDDEVPALRDLERVVKKHCPGEMVALANSPDEARRLCAARKFDVVFMDVDMPGISGLELAKELKELWPRINIIMTTAHPQYALDALKLFVSGYLLKPVMEEDIKEVLSNLRNPVPRYRDGLFVQCFGNFEVFYHGEPVKFGRSQAKEIFAYLVDLKGATATNAELRAVLWGDEADDSEKQKNYFAQLVRELKQSLAKIGCEDVLVQGRNAYAIKPDSFSCDYYEAMENDAQALRNFRGEYMKQYSWAEDRVGSICE